MPSLGLGIGTLVNCDAKDNSFYCKFAKLINILIWITVLFFLGKFALEYIKKK
jgi:hypothetical protein